MIQHIARIANTAREHNLGYGFLLTLVFEHFGVDLKKKVGVQAVDDIGSNTLMGCGFTLVEGPASENGARTPFPPSPGSSSSGPSIEALLQDQSRLRTELTEVKGALAEEKALNAKRHEDLLALLSALLAKLPLLLRETPLHPISVTCSLKHSALSVLFSNNALSLFSINYLHYLIVHF